jgi:phosphoribosylanthranilate isomerase
MTRIKICGIRRSEDVRILNSMLPEYAGFVFAVSRRRVGVKEAEYLCDELLPEIKRVGVFVNEEPEKILDIADICRLDAIQLHGDESPAYVINIRAMAMEEKMRGIKLRPFKIGDDGLEVWKAVRIRDENSINAIEGYLADAYVLDSFNEDSYGGTGKGFDLKFIADYSKQRKFILAGGLTPKNVARVIKDTEPFAVDVSSGVEGEDGFKDEKKIKTFIERVRAVC